MIEIITILLSFEESPAFMEPLVLSKNQDKVTDHLRLYKYFTTAIDLFSLFITKEAVKI